MLYIDFKGFFGIVVGKGFIGIKGIKLKKEFLGTFFNAIGKSLMISL